MRFFNETNFYFNKSSKWIKTTDWRWAPSLQEHTNVFPVCAWTPTLTKSCHWPVISTIKHLYIVSNCSAHRLRTPVYMLNFKTTFPLGRGTWWSGASHVFTQTAFSKNAEKTMFKLFGNRTSAGDNSDKLVSGHCLMLALHAGTDKHAMDNYTFN